MGFRFRKSLKLGGVRINLGKTGITSASIKPTNNTNLTVGKTGVSTSISFFGTGLSYIFKLFKW